MYLAHKDSVEDSLFFFGTSATPSQRLRVLLGDNFVASTVIYALGIYGPFLDARDLRRFDATLESTAKFGCWASNGSET